jgi:hypothetical protein
VREREKEEGRERTGERTERDCKGEGGRGREGGREKREGNKEGREGVAVSIQPAAALGLRSDEAAGHIRPYETAQEIQSIRPRRIHYQRGYLRPNQIFPTSCPSKCRVTCYPWILFPC